MNKNNPFTLHNPPDWNQIEAVSILSCSVVDDNIVQLTTTAGVLLLSLFDGGLRIQTQNQRQYDYGILIKSPELEPITVKSHEHSAVVLSQHQRVDITYAPLSIELFSNEQTRVMKSGDDGHFVRQHRLPPLAKVQGGWLWTLALASNEAIYGLGEKWGSLNKRGEVIRSYNVDALGVNAEISYKNTPFCWSTQGWGQFIHTPAPVTHYVGASNWSQRSYCAFIEDEYLDIFVFNGSACIANQTQASPCNASASIIAAYTAITGRASMPPRYSLGVILSKAYYQDPEELLSVAHKVREQKMPCDTITIDGRAWQDTHTRFSFEWDPSRWPDPKGVIDQLKELNFKVCIWEYPLISVENEWFELFANKGWLLSDVRTGEAFRYQWDRQAFGDVLTPLPDSGIVDFTHPDAYHFWREAHKPLFEVGIDMIKADFGEQLVDDNMLAHNGERGHALHNVYSLLYNQCVYEAADKYAHEGPFLFSRAAWAGSQRFNSQWGGDPQADWEGMMGNLRGGLSWGASGAPFYATDVGGFYKDTRDNALYVRWAQMAIFSAHFRLHGIGPREPWSYSEEANDAVMQALDLRYRLVLILQQAMQQSVATGMPVQRIMALAFPNEAQSWSFENQFMFGDHLLIAPCFDPTGKVQCFLPTGEWARFAPGRDYDKTVYNGGQCVELELSLQDMAVFARTGVELPLAGRVEYTDQFGDAIEAVEHWLVNT